MNSLKKEILRLRIAIFELEMRTQEQAALLHKEVHKRTDLVTSAVSLYIETTKSEWSDNHGEIKQILEILEDSKCKDLIRRADSVFQHRFEQLEALLGDFKAKIEALPDDE